ncbi:hypothetical protein AB1Y20_002160 [Prymnesium parvum]|uniref:Dolichol-phosphate mannosyltransferase subunit 3 n=1 Tax=Prymnesium parvum TaxID=97485 RepID=A0AB34J8C8_PRYPA
MHIKLEGILPTCASSAFALLFVGLCVHSLWTHEAEPPTRQLLDSRRLRPLLLVTLGWTALYFSFLQGQAAAAFWVHKLRREAAGKKDEPSPPRANRPLEFAHVKRRPSS